MTDRHLSPCLRCGTPDLACAELDASWCCARCWHVATTGDHEHDAQAQADLRERNP